MPSIRIGLTTNFNLVGEQVGIGTTNPTTTLEVAGEILTSNISAASGITTFTEYTGFLQPVQLVSNTVSIAETTKGNLNSLSDEIKISGEVTIESDVSVTGGRLDSLTTTDRFAVPSGDTNSRENTPEAGTIRFNQDFGTLEFFDGNNWKTVNSYARGGTSGRMVVGGGVVPSHSNVIQYFNINTFGNSQDYGDLTAARGNVASCSSAIRGIWVGGAAGSYIDTIEYVTIASVGDAFDFGNLSTSNRAYIGATSSSTRGIFGGGYQAAPLAAQTVNIIDYIEIPTLGNAIDFGDLFTGRYSAGALSNGVRAVWGGGNTPNKSIIDFVNIADRGNAVRFGDLTAARRNCSGGAFSNNVRGIFCGGQTPAFLNVMDYITIASEGNAIDFGSLHTTRGRPASSSTNTRGVMAGGINPSVLNSMEYVNITSTGDAQDFGDLYIGFGAGDGCSDSHGGLGGF